MINKVNWNEIPEKGYLLAYYQDGIEFCGYGSKEELRVQMEPWEERRLLEAHLFDAEKEWRFVLSRQRGEISRLMEGKDDGEEIFTEEMLIVSDHRRFDRVMKTIRVINWLAYDENDMLYVKGYRLAPGKEAVYE